MSDDANSRLPRATFSATVIPADAEPYETGTASNDSDYVCLRDATVVTEDETIQRTVMAFDAESSRLLEMLDQGGPLHLELFHRGGILKVAAFAQAA